MSGRSVVRRLIVASLVLLPVLAAPVTSAATLDVRPTFLQLLPGQKVGVLYLVNQDDAPHTYQIKSFTWKPSGTEQVQEPTDAVIANPAIIVLAPKQTQIVRYGLRSGQSTVPEQAFRIIIDEVPQEAAPPGSGLNVLLRISLPLFVRNVTQPPPPQLAVTWTEAAQTFHVQVANRGPYTTRVVEAKVVGEGVPAGLDLAQLHYVLPGGATDFSFKLPTAWVPRHASVLLTTDGGDLTLPLGAGG